MGFQLISLIVAAVFFALAAVGVGLGRVNPVGAGLFFLSLSTLLK
jgi:hypothetical protein